MHKFANQNEVRNGKKYHKGNSWIIANIKNYWIILKESEKFRLRIKEITIFTNENLETKSISVPYSNDTNG